MRRFLALITGEPKISDWEAGRQVGRKRGITDAAELKRYAEGIRRRYRELRKSGKLPGHGLAAIRSRRMLDAARRWYKDQIVGRKVKGEELADLEREAAARGIDVGPDVDLVALQLILRQRVEGLQIVVESPTQTGLGILLQKNRPPTAEALHREYLKATEELQEARQALKIVEKIRECRYYLSVVDFPQNGENE